MLDGSEPEEKSVATPSISDQKTVEYFEVQLTKLAVEAFMNKEYLKSSMLSWSCIEECYLPKLIEFVSNQHKLRFNNKFYEVNAYHLIKYYVLLSHDKELFSMLDKARDLRNDVVHKIYKSGTVKEIASKSRISADYNLNTLTPAILKRFSGKQKIPSLALYAQGWNDSRKEFRKMIQDSIDELKGENKL